MIDVLLALACWPVIGRVAGWMLQVVMWFVEDRP